MYTIFICFFSINFIMFAFELYTKIMKSLLLSPSHSLLSAKSFVQHLFKYPEGKEPERRMLSKSKKKKKEIKENSEGFY